MRVAKSILLTIVIISSELSPAITIESLECFMQKVIYTNWGFTAENSNKGTAKCYEVIFRNVVDDGDKVTFYAHYPDDNNKNNKPIKKLEYCTTNGHRVTYNAQTSDLECAKGGFLMPNSAYASRELKTVELKLIIHALNDYFLMNGHSVEIGKRI